MIIEIKQKMKLNFELSPCSKDNLMWVKDCEQNHKSMKPLKVKVDCTLHDIDMGTHFLNKIPIPLEIRPTIDKCDFTTKQSCLDVGQTVQSDE